MRIARVQVVNFRCLKELDTSLDDVTVLVGANGAGKSTLLHALRWFFEGGSLEAEDHAGHHTERDILVGVTFTDFNNADHLALGSYVIGDEASFFRTWSDVDGEKLTGKGFSYPAFNGVRQYAKAMPRREAYGALRVERPELGLPRAKSLAEVDAALDEWERGHPEELSEARVDATHLFGFTGGSRLNGRFDFVMVPAIADPEAQTRDARGTLLRQLLDRALGEQSELREQLAQLEEDVSRQMGEIVKAEGEQALKELARGVTEELVRFVPGSEVLLGAQTPAFRVPDLSVDVRVADGGLETQVGHQGHGLQRALLIAVVQKMAALAHAAGDGPDGAQAPSESPALFLALEEPELYQHPLQARHFANALAALADRTGANVQVAYATHSEHFVDPAHYHRLRRFHRRTGRDWPESEVTSATVDEVVKALEGAVGPDQVAIRVRMTLRRQVAEAVFAKAVVVVEGKSDAGLIHGLADREGGLDRLGVALVEGHSKRQMLLPWAILSHLGIPAYVVFDGDAGLAERLRGGGKSEEKAWEAQRHAGQENIVVQRVLRLEENQSPATEAGVSHTVFADTLEKECEQWHGFQDAVEGARVQTGDWREKSDDACRQAASETPDPPEIFRELMGRISALV